MAVAIEKNAGLVVAGNQLQPWQIFNADIGQTQEIDLWSGAVGLDAVGADLGAQRRGRHPCAAASYRPFILLYSSTASSSICIDTDSDQ